MPEFNQANYEQAIKDLKGSQVYATTLQHMMEHSMPKDFLTDEQFTWLIDHRDYLAGLLVVTIEDEKIPEEKRDLPENLPDLLRAWEKELTLQMTFLGGVFQEVQSITEDTKDAPLTEGEARRMKAAISDLMQANRQEQKETRELIPVLETIKSHPVKALNQETTLKSTEKKGFLARIFGK